MAEQRPIPGPRAGRGNAAEPVAWEEPGRCNVFRRLHCPQWRVLSGRRCGVNFSEHPPSKQGAALKYQGHPIAEVWFKPEGDPLALAFRVPRESFQIPGM